jgi:hypothetical protein
MLTSPVHISEGVQHLRSSIIISQNLQDAEALIKAVYAFLESSIAEKVAQAMKYDRTTLLVLHLSKYVQALTKILLRLLSVTSSQEIAEAEQHGCFMMSIPNIPSDLETFIKVPPGFNEPRWTEKCAQHVEGHRLTP